MGRGKMIKIVRSSSTNAEVTDYYLDVIASLMEACGEKKYEDDIDLKQCKKKDIIIAPTSVDFVKLYFKGYTIFIENLFDYLFIFIVKNDLPVFHTETKFFPDIIKSRSIGTGRRISIHSDGHDLSQHISTRIKK